MAHDRAKLIAELERRSAAEDRKPPVDSRSTGDLAVSLLLQERFTEVCRPREMTVTDIAGAAGVERSHLTAVMYARIPSATTSSWAAAVEPWFGLAAGSLMSRREGGDWSEDLSALDLPSQQEMLQAQNDRIERKLDELLELRDLMKEILRFRD